MGVALLGTVPSLVLNGHYVGADKLGHFFDQGYDYYEQVYVKHGDAREIIEKLGPADENGLNGMMGDGIRAYGDLAANFSGYLFWREVAQGSNPYFECKDGKYVRTKRRFDWSDYVNDGWDEGINCSEFNFLVRKSVDSALGKMGVKCPLKPEACQGIADLTCGYTFLSPACKPYVTPKTMGDSKCEALLKVDRSEAPTCRYGVALSRKSGVKDALDLGSGAVTLGRHKTRQVKDWADEEAHKFVRQLTKILDLPNNPR
jgi:hypothetical protein